MVFWNAICGRHLADTGLHRGHYCGGKGTPDFGLLVFLPAWDCSFQGIATRASGSSNSKGKKSNYEDDQSTWTWVKCMGLVVVRHHNSSRRSSLPCEPVGKGT